MSSGQQPRYIGINQADLPIHRSTSKQRACPAAAQEEEEEEEEVLLTAYIKGLDPGALVPKE